MLARMDIDISYTKVSRRNAIPLVICAFTAPVIALSGSRLRWIAAATGPERPQEAGGTQDFAAASVAKPEWSRKDASRLPRTRTFMHCVLFYRM